MIDLSKNQRSINTSGAHVDGGDVEALRAQFERKIGEAAPFPVERDGDSYVNRMCAWAWEGFQAGHAAAKAEAAAQQGDARVTLPDDIERMAVNRYRPVPSGVLAYKVVGGDGDRSLFSGTKDECQIVARKLTEAFLDGAHVALAAKAETADTSDGRWYALVKLANGETK